MAQAVTVLQDGTVGRIRKSAPTVFINSMAQAVTFARNDGVGADLYIRPNALHLYGQSIHSFRLWRPTPSGASGYGFAGRYRRADMQIRPYRFRKFNGASGYVCAERCRRGGFIYPP